MKLISKMALFSSLLLSVNLISASAHAEAVAVKTNTKVFTLKLSATRVIYNPDSGGASLSVSNQQDYPILVQGKVYTEDKKADSSFIVTPPLFRLEAGQQSRLRVIRTGGTVVPDRENMQWLCVGGIPPKNTDVWADDSVKKDSGSVALNLEVSAHNCIKLLVRPNGLKGTSMSAAENVDWSRQGNKISVRNASPFYINLSSVVVGGKPVKGLDYVPPFGERKFDLPEGASGKVEWKAITDVGGESRMFVSSSPV